jgi:hypothetical protein
MGCLDMILIMGLIVWVILVLVFLWAWSPFAALLVAAISAVIIWYSFRGLLR